MHPPSPAWANFSFDVCQKAAVATLCVVCTLWNRQNHAKLLDPDELFLKPIEAIFAIMEIVDMLCVKNNTELFLSCLDIRVFITSMGL